ncbi:hypothetical protein E2C01_098121 [Portunus trituberculatus]|uniref:Uncharacterized protein n=1 Tax=Portunus trituberculatus TaxID=210409 RepID=A0A5B7JWZ1_PORTR|nr:hypothetical protein [Portunus trituberculatus]
MNVQQCSVAWLLTAALAMTSGQTTGIRKAIETRLRAWRGVGCLPLYFTERTVKESPMCVLRLPRTKSNPGEVIHTSYKAVQAELIARYRISRKDLPEEQKDEVVDEKEEEKKISFAGFTQQEIKVECDEMTPFFIVPRRCRTQGGDVLQADLSLSLHLQEWEKISKRKAAGKQSILYIDCHGIKPFVIKRNSDRRRNKRKMKGLPPRHILRLL